MCCRARRFIERVILLFAGLVVFRTWFVEGFPVFCAVNGGSMATTLLGSHVDFVCSRCKFVFHCDAQDCDGTTLLCPNCSARLGIASPLVVLSGDRVLIDRTAYQLRRPERWEVVAFHRMKDNQDLTVKRVVGLPRENVQIIDGDIFINGQIVRKTLRQQRALRVLVHDDDHAGPTPRWRPLDAGSNWSRQNGCLVHAENTGEDIGWVVYNHPNPESDDPQALAPITNYEFFNRGRLQRRENLVPMSDVAMSFRVVEIHGRGLLSLQATDGQDEFMVQIDPGGGKFVLLKNRQTQAGVSGKIPASLRGQTIDVSLIDRQLLFAVGGHALATINMASPRRLPVAEQPLAIGVQGLGIVLDRLRVYRDVYYTEALFTGVHRGESSWQLGEDEYFVLGDNSPISEDSRTWRDDRFARFKSMVGKPFVVIVPSCEFSLGGWHIQVPDMARIRYIR
jgi:signal peptidase I